MQVDKASEKSVRITAMDTEDQGVKVFLIAVRITEYSTKFMYRSLYFQVSKCFNYYFPL